MSVLIRGMQIPSECSVCPMIQYGVFSGNTWCTLCSINKAVLAMDFKTIQFEGRHKDCPLVDLGSHGDLIDRDELKKDILKWLPPDPCGKEEKEFPFETDICVSMMMEIEEQDAVIEAEGAEK